MISTVVAFGCSMTWGSELRDPTMANLTADEDPRNNSYRLANSFPGIIASHYNLALENLAGPSHSVQSMIWNFEWWLDNIGQPENCLLLFGLTEPRRITWWDEHRSSGREPWHHYIQSNWLENPDSGPTYDRWYDLHKTWRAASSEALHTKQYQSAVYLFSGTCERLKIPYVQINMFSDMPKIPFSTVVNGHNGLEVCLKGDKTNVKHLLNGHPDEKGHKIIANYLIEHIDKKYFDRL